MAVPSWIHNGLQILLLAAGAAFILRVKIPAAVSWILAAIAVVGVLIPPLPLDAPKGDIGYFWEAGRLILAGKNPYSHGAILHPPTAMPFFALLGLMPWPVCVVFWRIFSTAGHLALVPFAARVLRDPEGQAAEDYRLKSSDLALLTASFLYSVAVRYSLAEGQLSFFPTLMLFGALWARNRRRPVTCGTTLAVVSMKITTLLPFLPLFFRKEDRKAWAAMVVMGLLLTFVATAPTELFPRLGNELANISHAGLPGEINDYSFTNARNEDLFTFDYVFYHLGIRNRTAVGVAQLAASAVLLGLAVCVCFRAPRVSWPGAFAIFSCAACLFLYHRLYDLVLLSLPLVYASGRGLQRDNPLRRLDQAAALAILFALYLRANHLVRLAERAKEGGLVGRLLEIVALPYGIWLTLAAFGLLALAERRRAAMMVRGSTP